MFLQILLKRKHEGVGEEPADESGALTEQHEAEEHPALRQRTGTGLSSSDEEDQDVEV